MYVIREYCSFGAFTVYKKKKNAPTSYKNENIFGTKKSIHVILSLAVKIMTIHVDISSFKTRTPHYFMRGFRAKVKSNQSEILHSESLNHFVK